MSSAYDTLGGTYLRFITPYFRTYKLCLVAYWAGSNTSAIQIVKSKGNT